MHIIPGPVQFETVDVVEFTWPEKAEIVTVSSQLAQEASYLVAELQRRIRLGDTTVVDKAASSPQAAAVHLHIREIPEACDCICRDEAYELVINAEGISIAAEHPAGVFYGIQSLLQLLPWSLDVPDSYPTLRGCRILDYPRFRWRGVLLDTGRHIFTAEFIKKLLDLMALHKLNKFHWHLTEDQGWRIEIRSLPLLTEVGAYRGEARYGGFYTQDQIRDIVKYAQERYIEVIPEIELPGHCMAALACYPHLSCTGAVTEVPTQWGVQTDVYCAGKDSTFQFLETVLDEVMELFPSKHIHIGGDECPKTRWASCEACQARIKAEGLSGEEQLQTYFINRVAQHLRKQGRCIIGWDEILEGGIPDEAVVMCWRGTIGGVAAAKHKHKVIMTPNTRCYFDYRQSGSMQEPGTWYAVLPLEWVYMFDPCCRTGQLDMRFFCPPEAPVTSSNPEEQAPEPVTDDTLASGQVMMPQKLAVDGVQPSQPSSVSDAEALTDARLTSTHPTCTSLSTTPLASTPTQQASPLAEQVDPTAAVIDADNGLNLSQNLPSSERSAVNAADCEACSAMDTDSMLQSSTMNTKADDAMAGTLSPQNDGDGLRVGGNKKSNIVAAAVAREASNELLAMETEECVDGVFEGGQLDTIGAIEREAVAGVDSLVVDDTEQGTEEEVAARNEALAQLQQEQWSQMHCRMDPDDQQYVIGGQANLWTEFISNEATAEYMLLPRLCALAECVWSPITTRHWQGFIDRTHHFLGKLSLAGYNYRSLEYKASGSLNVGA